ncbi:MAG: ATP-binding protein [Psychrosphaera sp.]|nr:ATP-binding protein [Psychrosphaera sp.]
MIQSIAIKNFMAFTKLAVDFSPGINIVIGENGTGKSQLLKAIYSIGSSKQQMKCKDDKDKDAIESAFTSRLLNLFMPLDEKLGKLHHYGAKEGAQIFAQLSNQQHINLTFGDSAKHVTQAANGQFGLNTQEPVFMPSTDVLSMMRGFNALYEKFNLSFDQSYPDICSSLDLPQVRESKRHPTAQWAIAAIEQVLAGKFKFQGGGIVTFVQDNHEQSANVVAEGFRKIGMFSRLLETGVIHPRQSGALLWDEPETNLNPKLMRLLVSILLELARNGQQIILTTHDYILLKWFDLLADQSKGDNITYISLYRDKSNQIQSTSTNNYLDISNSAISDSYAALYDEEVARAMR